jgi:hypothetical protein
MIIDMAATCFKATYFQSQSLLHSGKNAFNKRQRSAGNGQRVSGEPPRFNCFVGGALRRAHVTFLKIKGERLRATWRG